MSNLNEKSVIDKPVEFLEDEAQEGVNYIKPNLELKLNQKQKKQCLDLVLEIRKTGISQRQLLYLIDQLSLEIENLDLVRIIRNAIKNGRENLQESSLIIE